MSRLRDATSVEVASAAAVGIGLVFIFKALFTNTKSSNAPLVGKTGMIAAFKSIVDAPRIIREGYILHKPGSYFFRLLGYGDVVMFTSESMREELRKAPEDVLSPTAVALGLTTESKYTVGDIPNPFHIHLVTTRLTKNLESVFPEMYDELVHSFGDEFPTNDDGSWSTYFLGDRLKRVISRTSNRILVGLPLCRNTEWRDLQISFTITTVTDALFIKMFPEFMKGFIAKCFARGSKQVDHARRLITPLINERLAMVPAERPHDYLTWLMEEAAKHPGELEPAKLNHRLMIINFAAIHTTSIATQGVMYDLAARPEYIEPLREEVEEMTQKYGWTKKAIVAMKKLDSFVRESQRTSGPGFLSSPRIAVKDHTFSDGTFVRKGTWLAAPLEAVHRDNDNYPNASEFDGFRFSRLPEHENACNQIVSTSQIALIYGHGAHACPGRFFAANEIKTLVAHLLVTYDIKMKNEGVRPPPKAIGIHKMEDDSAEVCFRRRV